jgi:hypothetical protein
MSYPYASTAWRVKISVYRVHAPWVLSTEGRCLPVVVSGTSAGLVAFASMCRPRPAFTYSAATTRAKIDREAETFDDVMADRFA